MVLAGAEVGEDGEVGVDLFNPMLLTYMYLCMSSDTVLSVLDLL